MRLINTNSLKVETFRPSSIPKYAILSHTWLPEGEVTFQDMLIDGKAEAMVGYQKIIMICRLAREKNINYAWVDTCCIERSSSAELSESINAMFEWYQHSEVCLTYLSDLPRSAEPELDEATFTQCAWFTRGWTLQELLASKHIEFYDEQWKLVGTKERLHDIISRITGIQAGYLHGGIDSILAAPVGTRMFWAAKRQTTYPEDMAYSLLGIFDVNLPLLYGIGGERAFIRLQEEIIKDNNDLSIFAWTTPTEGYRGLLARSVSEFAHFTSDTGPFKRGEFNLTNSGLMIRTKLTSRPTHTGQVQVMNVGGREPIVIQRLDHLLVRSIQSLSILPGGNTEAYSQKDTKTIFVAKNIAKATEKVHDFPLYTINVKSCCEGQYSIQCLRPFPTTRWDVYDNCVSTAVTPAQSRSILGFVTFKLWRNPELPGPKEKDPFGSRLLLFMWLSKSSGDSFATPRYNLHLDNSEKATVASRLFAAVDQGGEDSYMSDIDMSPPFQRIFESDQPTSHTVTDLFSSSTRVRVSVKLDSVTNSAHNQAKFTYFISVEDVLSYFPEAASIEGNYSALGETCTTFTASGSMRSRTSQSQSLLPSQQSRELLLSTSRLPRPSRDRLHQAKAAVDPTSLGSQAPGATRILFSSGQVAMNRKLSSEFKYVWESTILPKLERLLDSIDQGGYLIKIKQGEDMITRIIYVQTDNQLDDTHREAVLGLKAELPEIFQPITTIDFIIGSGDIFFCVGREPFNDPQNPQLHDIAMCGDSVGVAGNISNTATLGPMLIMGEEPYWLVSLHLFTSCSKESSAQSEDAASDHEKKLIHPSEFDLHGARQENDEKPGTVIVATPRVIGHYNTDRCIDSVRGSSEIMRLDWALCTATEKPRVNTLRHMAPDPISKKFHSPIRGILSGNIGSRLVYSTGRTSGTRWGITCQVPCIRKEKGVRLQEWYVENLPKHEGGLMEDEWNSGGMGLPGDSGAPVIDAETHRLIGVIWGRQTDNDLLRPSHTAFFTPITAILDDIEEHFGLGPPILPEAEEPFCLINKQDESVDRSRELLAELELLGGQISEITRTERASSLDDEEPMNECKQEVAVDVWSSAVEVCDYDTLSSIVNLALNYLNQRRWDEAEQLFVKVMGMDARMPGPRHPLMLTSMIILSSTIENQGRWNEAEAMYLRLLKIKEHGFGQTHPETLVIVSSLARVLDRQGKYTEAESTNRKALKLSEEILGKIHPSTLTTMSNLAGVLDKQGKYDEAETMSRQILELLEEVLGKTHPNTLAVMSNLALILEEQGKYAEAEIINRQVLELKTEVLGKSHPDTLITMNNLAGVLDRQGRWEEAKNLEVMVIETKKGVLGPEHPSTLTSMANLALMYRSQGRWKEAEELGVLVMETSSRVLGPEHPSTLTSIANLASTYRSQDRWKEAEELGALVMETSSRVLGPEHPSTLTSMANLASTYRIQGRWKEAEELGALVMETSSRVLGPEHPSTLTIIANLASTYHNQGRWKEAEELEVLVMETSSRVLGQEHPDTLTSMANLALTFGSQGRWEEAEDLEVLVIKTSSKVLGREHPDTLTSMANLAFTRMQLGQLKEAIELLEECVSLRGQVLGVGHPNTSSSSLLLNEWRRSYSERLSK